MIQGDPNIPPDANGDSNEDGNATRSRKVWRIWAKALGPKEGCTNFEANMVAIIRTVFVVLTIVAEICIIYNTLTK